ncbi:MAG: glycosyltransferase family 4 protein [Candidatus Xenobia bacterium]
MRLAVTTFACDAGRSGIGQYTRHLLEALAESTEEVEVVGHPEEMQAFPVADRFHRVPVPATWSGAARNVLWQQVALPALAARRGWDLLFVPAANRRLPAHMPCPVVGTVHDLSPLHLADKYDRVHGLYIRHVLPQLIQRMQHVITVSEWTRQDVLRYARVPAEKVSVVPNGCDLKRFHPGDPAAARARSGMHRPYVLYVSRLEHPGKNHVRLIEAFARLKANSNLPHVLVLAGPDRERAREIHAAAAACSRRDDIVFTGFVADEALPDLYRGADMLVFPSLYEGFGIPILEAMACGTPVACSNVSSMPEVLGGCGLVFHPGDVDGIASAMGRMLTEPDLRESCIRRGVARACTCTWSRTATDTLELLRQTATRYKHIVNSADRRIQASNGAMRHV